MMWWLIVILVCLLVFFDVFYFIRGAIIYVQCLFKKINKYDIFTTVVTTGICLTTDLDFQFHMNNSRYLRECDFGRFKLWLLSGVWSSVRRLSGHVTLGCSTIRYRRSLQLGQKYLVKTRVLCWDDKAFYVEQRILRQSDNFIMAIVYIKQSIIKITPAQIVNDIMGRQVDSPQIPDDISKFIECHQISSENLKKES